MRRVGIWERDEGLYHALEKSLRRSTLPQPALLRGRHPADFFNEELDLLVISPNAIGWAGTSSISCRIVLLPGSAGHMARGLQVESAVSYGTGPKDTLSLSSLESDRIGLAIQRELVTVEGSVVDRQELVLPYSPERESPELFLCRIGAMLLLGSSTSALPTHH